MVIVRLRSDIYVWKALYPFLQFYSPALRASMDTEG